MAARGKAVRSAVSSGRHAITKGMRKTRSIGQDIERWWKVNEVQIPGTQDALYRAFLDSLPVERPVGRLCRMICRRQYFTLCMVLPSVGRLGPARPVTADT